MTQGRADGNEWVTAFMVSYSMNDYTWIYVMDQYGNQKVRLLVTKYLLYCFFNSF